MELQPSSVRGPRGVQLEDVCAAADAVLERGERPTIERIRLQLGRGSPNTVGPMLDSWYATLGKRLKSGLGGSSASIDIASGYAEEVVSGQLPAPVMRAAKALWGRAEQLAGERAQAGVAEQKLALAQEAMELQAQQEQFAVEKQRFAERASALEAAMFAKDQQILQLGRQLEEVKHMLQAKTDEAELLRSDLSKQRIAMDAMRQFTQVKDEEHRKERERIEERAKSQERRLLSEIDRARQATKAVEALLDAQEKQAARQLADSEERVRSMDDRLLATQEEKAGLLKDLLKAKDQLQRLQTEAASAQSPGSEALPRSGRLRAKAPVIPPKKRLRK
ncbi:DNA-binding protein [Diaphorobacter caeni]|uniref:DNA-binding protein n=1 Tax=Diaphorobacter caeni TaxID=2784387 RepID=UPI00188EEB5D|nr:DNA-binding protein [Diaphorobacter caeni]MBF5007381.1 DNA-binding protein [Diaphorobacter caeni]